MALPYRSYRIPRSWACSRNIVEFSAHVLRSYDDDGNKTDTWFAIDIVMENGDTFATTIYSWEIPDRLYFSIMHGGDPDDIDGLYMVACAKLGL